MPLFAFMRRVLGVLHFVCELEQGVFDVVKTIWWRFACAGAADGWHSSDEFVVGRFWLERLNIYTVDAKLCMFVSWTFD